MGAFGALLREMHFLEIADDVPAHLFVLHNSARQNRTLFSRAGNLESRVSEGQLDVVLTVQAPSWGP